MNNKVKKKAVKLYNRAQMDEGTEAAAAARLLDNLCARHGLTVETVEDWVLTGGVDGAVMRVINAKNGAMWRTDLLWALRKYTHTHVIRITGGKGKHRVGGQPADIETLRALFLRLEAEIETDATAYVASLPDWMDKGYKREKGNAYKAGEIAGIAERLARMAVESERAKVNAARWDEQDRGHLVVIGRALEAKEAAREGIRVRKTRSRSYDGDAFRRGYNRGKNRGVHRGGIGQRRRIK